MCVGITSNMSGPTVSVFDTGARPYLVRSSFLPVKCRDCIRPIHSTSLKSASNNTVHVIGKIMLFVHLRDLHVLAHFSVADSLSVPLLTGTVYIDRFFKVKLSMERCIVPIWSRTVATTSEYTSPSDSTQTLRQIVTTDRKITRVHPYSESRCVS